MKRWLVLGVVACGGCTASAADLRGLEAALGTAVSLGSASSMAMDEMSVSTVCASLVTGCATYPCAGSVAIQLGAGCPLPLGGTAAGTVNVAGSWQSLDAATLRNDFVGAVAGGHTVVVVGASNLTVSRASNNVTVKYLGQNVNLVRGASSLAGQSSWTVSVDTAGTPADPSDDTYTINGTDQGVGASVSQTNVTDVVVAPGCRLNPVSGSAVVQQVDTLDILQADIRFHAACDGRADVTSGGSSRPVALTFLQ